jgi:hypothetical protein
MAWWRGDMNRVKWQGGDLSAQMEAAGGECEHKSDRKECTDGFHNIDNAYFQFIRITLQNSVFIIPHPAFSQREKV